MKKSMLNNSKSIKSKDKDVRKGWGRWTETENMEKDIKVENYALTLKTIHYTWKQSHSTHMKKIWLCPIKIALESDS